MKKTCNVIINVSVRAQKEKKLKKTYEVRLILDKAQENTASKTRGPTKRYWHSPEKMSWRSSYLKHLKTFQRGGRAIHPRVSQTSMRRSPNTISFNDRSFGGTMFAFHKTIPREKLSYNGHYDLSSLNEIHLAPVLSQEVLAHYNIRGGFQFSARTNGSLFRGIQAPLCYRDRYRFKFSTITFSRLIGQLAKIYPSISPLCTFHRSRVFRLKLLHTLCRCDTKSLHKTTHVYGLYYHVIQVAICFYTARIFFPRKQRTQHVLYCA